MRTNVAVLSSFIDSNVLILFAHYCFQVNVHYRKVSVEIADDYRSVQLISASHTVRLQTVLSPFDIFISEYEMWIRCGDDNTAIHTIFNSTNVQVDVEQLAKLAFTNFANIFVSLV